MPQTGVASAHRIKDLLPLLVIPFFPVSCALHDPIYLLQASAPHQKRSESVEVNSAEGLAASGKSEIDSEERDWDAE